MRTFLSCALLCVLVAGFACAQGAHQPFGTDIESFAASACTPSGCPFLDDAAAAGAQWVRLLAIWHFLEPTEGNFQWGELPYQIWYATSQKHMNVYLTATWAPSWANGATQTTYPPYACSGQSQCQDVGRTVTSYNYTYNFFSALAREFNGSSVSGCSTNASTCHPLVQYFGVWNEPNEAQNFDDQYFAQNPGDYLDDFVNQFLSPAYNGVKAGNPSAYVVAPELSTTNSSCGYWSEPSGYSCGTWQASWMQPMAQYFSGSYDVISIHGYEAESTVKANVLQIEGSFNPAGKPIWVTEHEMGPSTQVTNTYVDEYNYQSFWTKVFWTFIPPAAGYTCSGATALFCSNNGGSTFVQNTAYFDAYYNVYYPH